MKKLSSLLLVLFMLFSLCGCEQETTDNIKFSTVTEQAKTKSEELAENNVTTKDTPFVEKETDTTSIVVYRTETGKKYHRESCRHLKSKVETTVDEALSMGLDPCSVCQPPQ